MLKADVALGLPEASTAAGARGQLGHGNRQDDNHSQTGSGMTFQAMRERERQRESESERERE